MPITRAERLARQIAIGLPAVLLGGAYISQYGFGLFPCELCWWQRYPHFAAVALALLAYLLPRPRLWTSLAAGAILTSAGIAGFHAGVEWGWWEGLDTCSGAASGGGGNALDNILGQSMISCDKAAWRLMGISLAGWNFLFSAAGGIAIFALLLRKPR
ncbi:disulfide bond formation protein B [Paraurantiacibacter namhicola]|uniref:Disulfide bond formation protein B n=1 Tax=Paraurantiacibacter namhicola TaxID=645517 RepID=A0A1C7D5G7_9SPHN|nr:disulfide bond formation protein B [Paraurantiacibacter namhicola]ANU06705.1 Disulfide bond formation protein B [Paraurantiacibacter namhicola]